MLSQAAEVLNAELYGADHLFTAVSKDTRTIKHGDLYVAIKGERFDGHAFVGQARKAGAVGALVQQKQADEVSQVCVDDTLQALGQLAANWRQRFTGKLIGLTGSNGKTTVKEMCRHVLMAVSDTDSVLATEGNLNNDIGMPMTLLRLREQHCYAVIEMGANHVGEIEYLTMIARPDIAILNNAGPAHLEGFGSIENVARAKAEIFDGLDDEGTAVINLDDRFSSQWLEACAGRNTITFSYNREQADIYAVKKQNGLVVHYGSAAAELKLAVPGKHNVMNALAAIAALVTAGLELDVVTHALASFSNISGRLDVVTLGSGAQIIDDTYNANPMSVRAAIDVLASHDAKTFFILGDMGELGNDAVKLHAQVGDYARQAGVDRLFAFGEFSKSAVEAFGAGAEHFDDKDKLTQMLSSELLAGCVALAKGSRAMRMETVVAALQDGADE